MCLYLIPTMELKVCPLSLFRGNIYIYIFFFFFDSVIKWQILKSSSHISQWFFPQLPPSDDHKSWFQDLSIFTKCALITSAPQATWRPSPSGVFPLCLWGDWPPLFCSLCLCSCGQGLQKSSGGCTFTPNSQVFFPWTFSRRNSSSLHIEDLFLAYV